MKKNLILIPFIILTSCSNQPKCDSADVKNEVKNIISREYKKEIQDEYYYQNYNRNDIYQYSKDRNLDFDKISQEISEKVKLEGVKYSDSVISNINIAFNNIRIIDINQDLKKCECAANLIFIDDVYDIEYSAQKTEDGNIYVEVSYY